MRPDLTSVVREYGPRIRTYFARRTSNQEDIEDLCSTVVVALADGISRFDRRSSVSTWVYAICRNVYSHHVYYRQRDRRLASEVQKSAATHTPPATSRVERLLSRLPESDRKLYTRYYVEGYSIRELSRMTNRPEGTVKYQLYQLRQRLRELLG